MNKLEDYFGMDIYLMDQLMRGNIKSEHRILDAGCGSGRNLIPLVNSGFNIQGFDPDEKRIAELRGKLADKSILNVSSLENFNSELKFDYIISNAVLHFAKDHAHFNTMFEKLVALLDFKGVLFIRMTSDIGQKNAMEIKDGVYKLPDGSTRYLISRERIGQMISNHKLKLKEPVKSLNVDGLRVMTTIVLSK